MKIKKGDTVLIITGKDRGKTGVVEAVLPEVNKVAVAGVNKFKKHAKPSRINPQGGIIEIVRPLHVSNVMLLDATTQKPTRVGYKFENNEKVRVAKATNNVVAAAEAKPRKAGK